MTFRDYAVGEHNLSGIHCLRKPVSGIAETGTQFNDECGLFDLCEQKKPADEPLHDWKILFQELNDKERRR